jgi:hypothetical protein
MDRREYLALSGSVLASLAGCTSTESDTPSNNTTDASTTTTTETSTTTDPSESTSEPTTQSTSEDTTTSTTTSEQSPFIIKIQYSGEWQGSITTVDSSRSIDGTGTTTFEVDGDVSTISANAQKSADNDQELTIQILQDGNVLEESSTTSEFGLAQVTYSSFNTGNNDDSEESPFTVRVDYTGEWQGSVSTDGSARSIDGQDSQTIDIEGSPSIISANAQKEDDSDRQLTIQIREDGSVVKEASTTAAYGMAQVSYSDY